jgi:hypothetical protein
MLGATTHVSVCTEKTSNEPTVDHVSRRRYLYVWAHVLWFACCACIQSHATMVLAITTDKAVYVGADGRTVPQGNTCKLAVGKRMAVGISGQLKDSATGFNAWVIVTAALVRPRDFASEIDTVITALEPPLERSRTWGFQHAPADYTAKFQGKLALALLLIGMDKDGPAIAHVAWRTENGRIFRLPQSTFGPNKFDAIGTYDAFLGYLGRSPEWERDLPVARIVKALEIESAADPNTVARPFAIVRITRGHGVEWIRHGACSARGAQGQQRRAPTRK